MSSSVVDQSSRMNGAATQNGNAANGNGSSSIHPEQHPLDVTDFGIFDDEIQNEMVNLKRGWSGIDQTFDRLHKIFDKHGRIVSTVKERYGDDNDLVQKIKVLEEQKRGFADVLMGRIHDHGVEVDELKSQHNTEIGALKKKHDKEISKWKEEAAAGDQKKKYYEELEKKSRADLAQERSKMEMEFREKEKKMKEEIIGLKKSNEVFEGQLKSATYNLARAREECQYLNEQNNDLRAPYLTVPEPVQHYAEQYESLFAKIEEIARTYFENLPEEALNQPAFTSMNLIKLHNLLVFKGIPITPDLCSKHLRLAAVQNVIYEAINNTLWKPWFCGYLRQNNEDQELVPKMFECLKDRGENERQNWKISTLRILERLDDTVDMVEIVTIPVKEIVRRLKPLLNENQSESLRTDLIDTFIKAIELGKKSQREKDPILISMEPTEADSEGWQEYLKDYERSSFVDSSFGSPVEPFHQRLLVSPLVYREANKPIGSMTRQKMSNDKRDSRTGDVQVICAGMALFSDTGILRDGAAQSKEINNAAREKVSTFGTGGNRNGGSSAASSPTMRRRVGSIPASVTASAAPSTLWGAGLGIATESTYG
ncbi:hypothetical protein H2204_012895 [Knufia peltigerae]|nr:hypothetical protein H2204_012895 [Knufia peltigerae]